jgi:hypothetical protein
MSYEEEMSRRLQELGEWILRQKNGNVHVTIRILKRKLEKLDISVDE